MVLFSVIQFRDFVSRQGSLLLVLYCGARFFNINDWARVLLESCNTISHRYNTIITRKNRPLKSASFFNLSIVRWSVLGAILFFFLSNAYSKSKQKRSKPRCIRLRHCRRSPEWMWNFRNIHSCMCYLTGCAVSGLIVFIHVI